MTFDRVVVPLDGSEMAEVILGRARPILSAARDIVLLRVTDIPPGVSPGHPMAQLGSASILETLSRDAEEYVDGRAAALRAEGLPARSVTKVGLAADRILDVAGQEAADLIVLTTHGRTGLARWIFGSVTEKILRHAPCPLLIVHSFERSPEKTLSATSAPLTAHRILVPVDGSESSTSVAGHALRMAKLFGATVEVLHVMEPLEETPLPPLEAQVARTAAEIEAGGVAVEVVHRKGDAAQEILERCDEAGCDMICMTSHGRGGIARWVLGSVAEKVTRSARVPVHLIRVPSD